MTAGEVTEIGRRVRSPRSAAYAGIVFSVLFIITMILLYELLPKDIDEIGIEWLENWSKVASVVVYIVPISGLAFLWFTGVIRDLLDKYEDRFFSTLFLGSGIILVAMMFVWASVFGAIFVTFSLAGERLVELDVYIFGVVLADQIIGNFFLRMAAVYMISIGSLWSRINLFPRWLVLTTLAIGLVFMLFAGSVRQFRFLFPGWVFVISIYVLIHNRRRAREQSRQVTSSS